MIDQYPFEGFTDIYPTTETTPDWFGFGVKNFEQKSHPVKHIVYADGQRRAVIAINPQMADGHVERQIMDRLKGPDAESPHVDITGHLSYNRTAGAGHGGQGMWQLPDTRPGRFHRGKG